MIKIVKNGMRIQLDENTLAFSFQKEGGREWRWNEDYAPYMECAEGIVFFRDASEISHETFRLGTGEGILSTYRGFEKDGKLVPYEFQTLVWVEDATGDVSCEWIPLQEEGLDVKKVFWPGPMEFAQKRKDWYTLLTQQQGMLIPNTWETELQKPVFDGFFGTAGAYMPWFAQVREREGYLAVCVTPWNAGYQAEHPAGGPYTRVSVRFEPSLGKMRERRVLKYTFFNDCDYNDICKVYRNEVDEQGRLRTLEEKAELLTGGDFWHPRAMERLGIPAVMMSDGPSGLRKQEQESDHLGIYGSTPAVCFPSSAAVAASFDTALAQKLGCVVGNECQAEGVALLLGPGLNIKRSPLCGRNFEYYSEDPVLAGQMGAAMVEGVQSTGTGSCIKHFAANNQETDRMVGDSVVDERTLHEIYLAPFETVVKEAKPQAVMCAYNKVNGIFCSENGTLLTDILRSAWGYQGMVVTDWGAVKNRAVGVRAGLDLEMPGGSRRGIQQVLDAVAAGTLTEAEVDRAVYNVLKLVQKEIENHHQDAVFDRAADHDFARHVAEECAVLLKNKAIPQRKILPINFIVKFISRI